jgi:hypothetical protein
VLGIGVSGLDGVQQTRYEGTQRCGGVRAGVGWYATRCSATTVFPVPGAALDHQHSQVIEPDDLVLLGLDRRHDGAHPSPRRVDRRVPTLATARAAEHLVVEIDHLAPACVELAAPTHVLRGRGGADKAAKHKLHRRAVESSHEPDT